MKSTQIISDPAILGGKPIIKGTRIAVSTILDLLASGLTQKEVLQEYPILTKGDIQKVIMFAAERMKREVNFPLKRRGSSIVFSSL